MSKNNKKKKKDEVKENKDTDTGSKRKQFINTFILPIFPSIFATVICAVAVYFISGVRDLMKLPERMDSLEARIEKLETGNTESSDSESPIPVHIDINMGKILWPTEEGAIEVSSDSKELPLLMSQPSWISTDIIGIDTKSGIGYTAKELVNQKILLPTKNGNQESYFYVRFNENNHWDGECVINNYENDKLVSIMEAVYDDGKLMVYEQAMQSTTSAGNVWNISDRINEGDYNRGETWNYIYKDITKNFKLEDITIKDLVSIEELKTKLMESESWLEGYYKGNTSEGYYNDNTDKAYLIKYFEDGTIRTLYKGRFKDGEFEDTTGKAWYITRGPIGYMYYKGYYIKGVTNNNSGHTFEDPPLSLERINGLLKENGWDEDIELKWNVSDNTEQGN